MRISTFIIFMLFVLGIIGIISIEYIVSKSTKTYITSEIETIPKTTAGLILGTSKYTMDGRFNAFYIHRINATVELFEAEKIDAVIVSGDNSTEAYNEPETIKTDLIARGIDEDQIYLDYAGFRTLDSVIRAKEIFGQTNVVIISQRFHLERAIYLARDNGIFALGYAAKDVPIKLAPKVWIRERFARVKMMYDVIFNTEATVLGEKIEIE